MLKLEKELNNFEDTCDCYQIRHVSVKVWIKVKGGKQIAVSAQRYRDGSHFLLLKRWQQSVTHSGSSFYGLIKRNKWEDNNNVWIQSLRLENFRRINIKIYILFRYVSASRYWAKSPEMDLTNATLVTADWFMESFSINQLKKKKKKCGRLLLQVGVESAVMWLLDQTVEVKAFDLKVHLHSNPLLRSWAVGSDRKNEIAWLCDKVKSLVIHRELGLEPLLPSIRINQLRCFGHLIRMPPERLPLEVSEAHPPGRRPQSRPRTGTRVNISYSGRTGKINILLMLI